MQPSAHPPSPVRILLAEDDPDQQDLLTRVLTRGRPHVKVDLVASASELDRSVRAATYDCIVLDYNLPDRTADEAIRSSRDFLGQTPVVVVSSSLDQDVVLRSARAGGVDFVKKTDAMRSDELWERVTHAINESIARLDRKIAARLRLESKDREIAKLRRAQGQSPTKGGPDAGS